MNQVYKFQSYKKSNVLRNHLNLGGANNAGERIDVTSLYLERGEKPWIGVTGEYHFSRGNREDWYKELCKMKAGGVNVVATYLFWIYHEEIEGEFDFSGDLDIRKFIEESKRVGLDIILRIGPWAHGECRNGGFPDWLLKKPYKLRDNNVDYMEKSRIWYEKIYEQVEGNFYKDGGNIIGIQVENELVDNGEHLLALKNLAKEVGFDVPLYTVTGWNSRFGAKIPVDDVLPVFAAYADAPWASGTHQLPLSSHYVFDKNRNDSAVGVDVIKDTDSSGWRLPYERYPYAMCQLGSGLHPTHHRRPVITGMDAYALTLVKLGSGNNLLGYYMYHGGVNKIGKLSTFNETKATGYPNDYPVLNYDFHTAMTSYGETREQYGLLNILHLFVQDFGDVLAPMDVDLSEESTTADNLSKLRYCMRSNGESGFVFINNYQRLAMMEEIKEVVIDTDVVVYPSMDIKSGVSFFLPYSMKLGDNVLEYATTQPLCVVGNTYFFVAIEGIHPKYKFANEEEITSKIGQDSIIIYKGVTIVTLPLEMAKYARKLKDTLYIGEQVDLYEMNGEIQAVQHGNYSYMAWNGSSFVSKDVTVEFEQAEVTFTDVEEPYEPKYVYELMLGVEKSRHWKKIAVTSDVGFIDIPFPCDVEQVYADGELVADAYYNGQSLRIPASLVYGKESYFVYTEIKEKFYKEF